MNCYGYCRKLGHVYLRLVLKQFLGMGYTFINKSLNSTYNIKNDIQEKENLVNKYPELVMKLKEQYAAWFSEPRQAYETVK